jgi:hypothetical protein
MGLHDQEARNVDGLSWKSVECGVAEVSSVGEWALCV